MEISEQLKRLRIKRNFSKLSLSEKAEISIRMIDHIEKGTHKPSFMTLDKICKAIGLEYEVKIKEKKIK